jgi:hypothetical protein
MNNNGSSPIRNRSSIDWIYSLMMFAGCRRAPSFDVVGSFFPAWLFCLVVAILLTVLARWLFLRLGVRFTPPILIYPSLTAAFAFAIWLIFFR